ncbi:MAG TPA: redoxin domain-containing protein [Thiobacillus sp.]|nr:redoxin domain-containing protein [Thiobacillus sp.]
MKRALAGIALFLAAWASSAGATEPQSFTADSLAAIKAKYAGRPFILSLWSVNWCGHCITELTMLGQVAKTQKQLPLVLVSTDTPESSPAVQNTLKRLGLARMDSWVFDDDIPERLRHAIDPVWHGELPRTYLYDAHHQRQVVAGVLKEGQLQAWLKQHQ